MTGTNKARVTKSAEGRWEGDTRQNVNMERLAPIEQAECEIECVINQEKK